jgi:hypothetical protein
MGPEGTTIFSGTLATGAAEAAGAAGAGAGSDATGAGGGVLQPLRKAKTTEPMVKKPQVILL